MHLMYVDDAGDSGMVNSPTRYFMLSGLVVHELRWRQYLDQLIAFRQRMKALYGIRLAEELHAQSFIQKPGALARIPKHHRLAILRAHVNELALMSDFTVINVIVDKYQKAPEFDPFEMAWRVLIQRFENTSRARNFNGPSNADERGTVYPDVTAVRKLTRLVRRMHRYNPVPNQPQFGVGFRNMPLRFVLEDPSFRDSEQSYFIQAVDTIAYFLYQREVPCAYILRRGAAKYFERLKPLICIAASPRQPWGIVRI